MPELFSAEMRRNPYPLYEHLRRESPVFHEPRAGLWMVFAYDDVKRVLTDHASFSSRAAPPGGQPLDWMIFQDPPRQTKLRALVLRAFTPRVIAALEPRIHTLVHELVDAAVARGQQMDVAADLAVPLPLRVIADMIGIPFADRARFQRWSDAILGLSETIAGGDGAEHAVIAYRAASAEMRAYLADAVPRRRERPEDDLLSRLVVAELDGDRLSDDEILGFFQLLLVAGSETTTNLIGNAVLCFAERPEVPELLRTTPELLPSVIEEVLRYRSPVQAMFRRTTHAIELHGQTVPADQLVLAMIGSANRDPAHFDRADRFEPTRDPNPHVAFGHGVHFCLGAPLARLEGRIALEYLLERVPRFELAGEWEPRKAFHIHGPIHLPIRLEPADR